MVTQHTRQAYLHLTLQPQASSIGLGLRPGRFGPGPKFTQCRLEAVGQLLLPAVLTSALLHRNPSFVALHRPRAVTCRPPDHQQSQVPQVEAIMDLKYILNSSDIFDPFTPKTLDRSFPSNEPVAAPYATEDDSPDGGSICRECRQVDWDSLPTLAEIFTWGDHFRIIRTIEANHEQLATSSCKICRILSAVKPQSLDNKKCILVARPLFDFIAYAQPGYWGSRYNNTALHVCLRDEIFHSEISYSSCLVAIRRDNEDFNSRTISPRSIDYDWLRGLARSCEENHEEPCRASSPGPVAVSGLKVIETSSRTVVEATAGCRYVALSYVWGEQQDVDPASPLHRPPQLIEDAISVTIAMGYKYLWIDRYVSRHDMTFTNSFR